MESAGKSINDLTKLYQEAVYGKSPEKQEAQRRKDDDLAGSPKKKMVVTNADKKANTPAYQNFKKGDKRYTAADHMKESENETIKSLRNIVEKKKDKDTPDQVAAVIDYYRSKKGTDEATKDSEEGDDAAAKKERDYAKFERDKMARDAQKSGHPWEHAKGSTSEKEGKKSVKHAHVKDSYDPNHGKEMQGYVDAYQKIYEEPIQGEGTKGEMKKELKDLKKGAQGSAKSVAKADAVKEVGEEVVLEKDLNAAERRALPDKDFALPGKGKGPEGKQAGSYPIPDKKHALSALSLVSQHGTPEEKEKVRAKVKKKFPDIDVSEEVEALKRLVESGKFTDEEIETMAWDVYEGYQRNPEKGEEEERKAEKRRRESGQMPPRGDKRREDFERWYAANVR